jgi:hypothetical protein
MKALKITLATTKDASEWDDIVRNTVNGTVYHLFAWHQLYHKVGRPYYFLARDQGKIVGIFPMVQLEERGIRKFLSLPQGVGGFCISEQAEKKELVASELLNAAIKEAQRQGCHQLEIKADACHAELYKEFRRIRFALGYSVSVKDGWDIVWNKGFNKKARKNVRHAIKAGCVTRLYRGCEITEDILHQFYEMHKGVSERHRQDAIDIETFVGIRTYMDNKCHICMTYYRDLPVAVRFFIDDPEMGSVSMYMGASNSDYWKYYPNDLGYAETIRWSAENEYQWVDLGFSPYPSEKSGHAHFKSRWGGEEYKVDLFQYDLKPFSLLVKRALAKIHEFPMKR